MWVMALEDVLGLKSLEPHQHHLKEGKLQRYNEKMFVIFISHEWCGGVHPDPKLEQLTMFQSVFGPKGLVAGRPAEIGKGVLYQKITTETKAADYTDLPALLRSQAAEKNIFVWLDFICVPQTSFDPSCHEEQVNAISSIHSYVARSQLFVALVPPLMHLSKPDKPCEMNTWLRRGWCRVEAAAQMMTSRLPALLVQGRDCVSWYPMALDPLPPGLGEFGCCEMCHVLPDGSRISCDKVALKGVVEQLAECQLVKALERTELSEYRQAICTQRKMLERLGESDASATGGVAEVSETEAAEADASSLASFLQTFRFEHAAVVTSHNETPLLYAAMLGDAGVLRALLKRDDVCAQINLPTTALLGRLPEGSTPLYAAALDGEAIGLQLLVDHGADPLVKPQPVKILGGTSIMGEIGVLERLVMTGRPSGVEWWLRRFGIEMRGGARGHCMPLCHMCTVTPTTEQPLACLRLLVDLGGEALTSYDRIGSHILHNAAITLDASTFKELMKIVPASLVNGDRQRRVPVKWSEPRIKLIGTIAMWLFRTGRTKKTGKHLIMKIFANVPGATPLHISVSFGNYGVTKALLESGADPTIRNNVGLTPLQRARIQSGRFPEIEELVERHLEAFSGSAKKAKGRSPSAAAASFESVPPPVEPASLGSHTE